MELKFKNVTKYSKQVYDEFLRFHTQRNINKYVLYTCLVILGLVYAITYNAAKGKWINMCAIILIAILFIIYRIYSQKIIIKNESKSDKIKNEEEFEFYFYDELIIIKKNQEEDKIKYKKIYKIFETKKYFYLYVNKNDALLLSKKGFLLGNSEKFKEFITNKRKVIEQ